jgi:NitT/TauT family transport system permease protein
MSTVGVADVAPEVGAEAEAPAPAGAPAAARRRPKRRIGATVLPPLVVLAALIGLWYFLGYRLPEERRFLLPYPHEVVQEGVLDGEAFSEIMASMWLTTRLALTGLVLAIALGMLLGIAMHRSNLVERAAYPYLVALQAIPILAITPLMIIAFGSGAVSKTVVCVIIAFFPIPTNLLLGMKSVDRGMPPGAPGCAACRCPRRCPRCSPASASRPASP